MGEELECDIGEDCYRLGSRLLQEGGAEVWAWRATARNSSNGGRMHSSIARRDLSRF